MMSDNLPSISVIMPCYNAERFISHSIESIIAQTYQNWELLVIDDCSKDKSAEIIMSYCGKDSRIKYLKTDAASGSPAEPRNAGISAAKGRFIAFLDSDDLWLPTKLMNQINKYLETERKDSSIAVVFSDYEKFSDAKNAVKKSKRIVKAPKLVSYQRLLNGNCIGNLTGMFDTVKIGKVYQKKIGHEDYLFWLTCLRPSDGNKSGFKALNTQTVEGRYRQTNVSTSGNKGNAFRWTWNIYRNELNQGMFSSLYHFTLYAFKGVLKFIK